MKKNVCFMMVIILLLVGCQWSRESIQLEGKSDHWKTKFIVTKSIEKRKNYSQPKYIMETFIDCSDKSLIVYDLSYEVIIADLHQSSGKMNAPEGKRSASFSPRSELYSTPESGDEIIVKIKWNESNEEEIVMKVE